MAELTGIVSVEELEALSKKLKAQQEANLAQGLGAQFGITSTVEDQIVLDETSGPSAVGRARAGGRDQSLTDIVATRARGRRPS